MPLHSAEELRIMRYWYAATVIGKMVMVSVLLSLTEGKATTTYKEDLLAYYALKPNKKIPEGLYKNDFNDGERKMLEDPSISPENFDVTLIDKLLRRLQPLTGFAHYYDKVWTEDEPPGNNASIEYSIYKVKTNRNNACHPAFDLSESKLERGLREMENLYIKLVEEVMTKKGKPARIISTKIDQIKKEFLNLKTPIHEALTDRDVEVYIKQKRESLKMLQEEVRDKCQFHLKKLYKETYETNPLDWLDIPLQIDRVNNFTEVVIEEENNLPNTNERKFEYTEMLNIKTKDLKTPRILKITAIGGNGKTTYTRLFVCKWSKDQSSLPGLDEVDILLFVELRNVSESSFDDLLRNQLGNVMMDIGLTFQNLKDIIMTLKVLVILDGQDETANND
ncbi:unnamed protein product, partial [Meganyctiphanes norvegica]